MHVTYVYMCAFNECLIDLYFGGVYNGGRSPKSELMRAPDDTLTSAFRDLWAFIRASRWSAACSRSNCISAESRILFWAAPSNTCPTSEFAREAVDHVVGWPPWGGGSCGAFFDLVAFKRFLKTSSRSLRSASS